jgi:lauroyl/myristoyl acyltransferase
MRSGAPRWYAHPYNRAVFYRLAGAAAWLPRAARLRLAVAIGDVAAAVMPVERAVVRRNLEQVTGAAGNRLDELTRDVFRNFAMCFADLVTTNRCSADRLARRVAPLDGAARLARSETGFISLTAHLGNWELAGRMLAWKAARPTHVVVAEEEAPGLERWIRRDGAGLRFVTRSQPTVALELLTALRRGEIVALQGDRALGGRGDVLTPFFGRPAPFPIGPFVLARASGAPLAPAFCVLATDRRYAMRLGEPFTVKAGGEEDALRRWVHLLEETVLAHATQWFNFFDVWNPADA